MRRSGFRLIHPSFRELQLAETIARHGQDAQANPPQLRDSIYHAMAIERGGTFITADRKHIEKTRYLGHAIALSEWRLDHD